MLLLIYCCVFCGVSVNSITKYDKYVGILIYLYDHKTACLNSKIGNTAKGAKTFLQTRNRSLIGLVKPFSWSISLCYIVKISI